MEVTTMQKNATLYRVYNNIIIVLYTIILSLIYYKKVVTSVTSIDTS